MSDTEPEKEKDSVSEEEEETLHPPAKVKMRRSGFMGSMSMLNPAPSSHHISLIPELRKRSKSAINLGRILRMNSLTSLKIKEVIYVKDIDRDSGVVVDNHEVVLDEKTRNELVGRRKSKLHELLETEERYFGDLLKMSTIFVEIRKSKEDPDYPVQMPIDLKRICSIFLGNFHEIRDFHKEVFTDKMRSSIWRADEMRDLFRRRQHEMKSIYGKYCSNWKKCEYIMKKHHSYFNQMEQHIESDTTLQDQMIKPIQMINRYHLFFADLVKICERLDKSDEHILFAECLFFSKEISQYVNDIMATGRIENFPQTEDINSQGNLLHRGFAEYRIGIQIPAFGSYFFSKIMNNDTHEIPVHMFLFEKSFIVCYYKKNAREFELADEYRYWTMFQIKKMKIENGENREFIVTDTETEQSVTLVANTVEEKDEWVKRIKKEVRNIDKLVKKLMMQAVSIDPESPP